MSGNRVSLNGEFHEFRGDFDFLDYLYELQELDQLDIELQEEDLPGLSVIQVAELQEILDNLDRKIEAGLNLLGLLESQKTDCQITETEISSEDWASETSENFSIDWFSFEPHYNMQISTMLEPLDLPQFRDAQMMPTCPGKCILPIDYCTISEQRELAEALQGADVGRNQCTSAREDPFFRHFREFAAKQGPCVPKKSRFFPTQGASAF